MTTSLTVIGGYLGAGKTTLINALLAHNPTERLAILVNDFGQVNIDARLIAAHDGPTLRLTNGCVCCSLADDLGSALTRLEAFTLDHVLIEASGAALPRNVAAMGDTWPGFRLNQCVVLVDAADVVRLERDPYVGPLVKSQLSDADLRLATKLDLCDTPQVRLDDLTARYGTTRPISHGDIDPTVLFSPPTAPMGAQLGPAPAHNFVTATFERSGDKSVTLPLLEVRQLLARAAHKLERAKGWIATEHGHYLVQLAGRRVVTQRCAAPADGGSSIALISKGADAKTLARELEQLASAQSSPDS